MSELAEILQFAKGQTGFDEVLENSDIVNELGCNGDDFDELMVEFARRYKVDMSSYRWYFHHCEEGQNIGGLFFSPPNQRVQR